MSPLVNTVPICGEIWHVQVRDFKAEVEMTDRVIIRIASTVRRNGVILRLK